VGEFRDTLTRIEHGLTALTRTLEDIMRVDLTSLKNAVAANTAVDQSAMVLLSGLTAKIQELIAASGDTIDPVELQAIVDQVNTDNTALAAAVAANTPAAP
jgi:hypothetical protein